MRSYMQFGKTWNNTHQNRQDKTILQLKVYQNMQANVMETEALSMVTSSLVQQLTTLISNMLQNEVLA